MATKKDALSAASEIAATVIKLRKMGMHDTAGLVLATEAEKMGRIHKLSYSDAKQMIGTLLAVA